MTYPPAIWRLIRNAPSQGAWNMAVDEAILESTGRGESPPTLRLYAWDPPCLSIGYAQQISEVDQSQLSQLGWQCVRRPTGGRAILHTDELTYAVIGPVDEPRLAGSLLECYQRLAQVLLDALQLLGIPASINPASESIPLTAGFNPVCFEVPSQSEITWNDMKLIGSAQARRKDAILQHGSLPLYGDLTRIIQVLSFPDESHRHKAITRLRKRATTAEDILGYRLEWETASQAFERAFARVLNLTFQSGGLSPSESLRAYELYKIKYTTSQWMENR